MNNIRTTVKDYYNERVYSKRFGYGELTKVYGDEIYFKFDNWGFYRYSSNPFEDGSITFVNHDLLSGFTIAYKNHVNSQSGSFEIYDTWFRRGS